MKPPKVQSLSQIIAELNPAFNPQRDALRAGTSNVQNQVQSAIQGLDATKTQAFGGIEQAAQNKGMFFSGFAPNEQASYLSTKYLPAVAEMQAKGFAAENDLVSQLAKLDAEVRTNALGRRDTQLDQLRQFQEFQANLALERRKLAQQLQIAQMDNATRRATAGGGAEVDYGANLINDMTKWFKKSKGMPSRQAQDKFVDSWMNAQGVKGAANRQVFWDLVNSNFKRVEDPTKDYYWKR